MGYSTHKGKGRRSGSMPFDLFLKERPGFPMRLTLRTLLAWLDDTLTPAEVRAIGKQVAELDFAKELVERIHKVTRQRRLTVPSRTGPDAVDPNLVASYLDSELDPELVAEFEKKCLISDVHLAEVASVHQILSLIGQKAKVPPEARERMYQLIKGRESIRPKADVRPPKKGVESTPKADPVKLSAVPSPPRRKRLEQLGPIVALAALIVILCWSAWVSLTPEGDVARPIARRAPAKNDAAKKQAPEIVANAGTAIAEPLKGVDSPEKAAPKSDAGKVVPAEAVAKPARAFAEGVVGKADKPTGVLARFNAEKHEWVRLIDETPLREGDRILNLEPYRATIMTPRASVELIGETEVAAHETPSNLAARVELTHGRIVMETESPTLPFEIVSIGSTITIQAESRQKIGIERLTRRAQGSAAFVPPILRFELTDGSAKLKAAEGAEVSLEGPGSIVFESPSTWSETSANPVPPWVALTPVEPEKAKAGEAFLNVFQPERTMIWSLVEALEVKNPAVCALAIPALRAVGDLEYIVPLLNRNGVANSAAARKAAIATLRDALAESPESANRVHEQLVSDLGVDIANSVERLLIGFPPDSADPLEIWSRLVIVIETQDESDVGLRQLSLDALMSLSGLGDLGYDPEHPSGDGLKAWKKLEVEKRAKAAAESAPSPKEGAR